MQEQQIPVPKTIAIIGGGISGIASAKASLDQGFLPTIFEKREDIGGVWSRTGYTWNSMIGNSSRYMGKFSDHEFPADASLFSKRGEVIEYMKTYIEKYGFTHDIKLNAEVLRISFTDETQKKWKVEWTEASCKEIYVKEFDFLIVATGFYNMPNLDAYKECIQDPSNEKIKFMHSMEYKENSQFRDKNVILVGCSYSSTQIASEIAQVSKSLVNVFRRPSWILSRILYNSYYKKPLPVDFTFFTLQVFMKAAESSHLSPEERFRKQNQMFAKFSKQNEVSKELFIDENSTNAPIISLADDYLDAVEKKLLTPKRDEIVSIKDNTVTLRDGTVLKPDIVMFSTGFKHLLPSIDDQILKSLHYDTNNQLSPLNLYNLTFNPLYSNLAFVGVYKGLFLGTAELQAKYALNYFIGKNKVPLVEIEEHLKKDLLLRNAIVQPQYANGGYVNFLNIMAKEMDMMPDFEKMKVEDPEIYDIAINGVAHPPIYFLNFENESQRKEARESLMRMKEKLDLAH